MNDITIKTGKKISRTESEKMTSSTLLKNL